MRKDDNVTDKALLMKDGVNACVRPHGTRCRVMVMDDLHLMSKLETRDFSTFQL